MQYCGLQLILVCSNDDPGMTLTYFTGDLKGSRSRHLIRRYVSIECQGHFLTLAQGRVHTKIQTGFSKKLLYRSEPNFA